ncbi:MAG TPA: tetratricopeptide repeat protein [Gemmataceae bacterium]|jgi:lipoprotein NlpI|nr:tetratricopeptide repeat protein [Gemmataceae bacterium]
MYRLVICLIALVPIAARADTPKELLEKANEALKKNDRTEALKLVEQAIAADPKNAEAYSLRGDIRIAGRQFDKAVADYSKAIELNPQFAPAYDQRGTAYFKLAKIPESLADFNKFIELEPKAAPGHWRRGLTLYYAEKFADGVAQFTTSDKTEPNDVENAIWHFLCNARVQGVEKARGEFLKVKEDPRGVYMMKIFELFLGKAKPEDVFAAAESGQGNKDPERIRKFYANYYVGMYYEATGEPKKSLELLKEAVLQYPNNHYMMDVALVHIQLRKKK